MAAPDLTTAEGILRELWDVRASKTELSPETVRARQKAAWQAARKLLGIVKTSDAKASPEAASEG